MFSKKKLIPKGLLGLNTEWADNWKFRMTPASKSRVLQGKGVESNKEYTERRKREETKRTWRSDAADIAHGVGEGVLALHPYTAVPYFGAKVGKDFLNGNVNWQTALNVSIPLFHFTPTPSANTVINSALEGAAKAGSKTARNWRVAREIKLGIKLNTKNGRIEVTDNYFNAPDKWYRIANRPEKMSIELEGRNITTRDADYTPGTPNRWRADMQDTGEIDIFDFFNGGRHLEPGKNVNEGYFVFRPGSRAHKTGSAHGNTSLASKGSVWKGSVSGNSELFPMGIIEGQAPLVVPYGRTRSNFVNTPWEEVPEGGRVGFHTGEMPMSNLGWFLRLPNGRYTYEPIIPEKRISYQPKLLLEPSTINWKTALNVKLITDHNLWASQYGYKELPYKLSLSNRRTNKAVRKTIARHNSFYRGINPRMATEQDILHYTSSLKNGEAPTMEGFIKFAATNPRSEGAGIFVSPFSANSSIYGNGSTNLVRRLYKLGKDRSLWFKLGDFEVLSIYDKLKNLSGSPVINPWEVIRSPFEPKINNGTDMANELILFDKLHYAGPRSYKAKGETTNKTNVTLWHE